MGTETKIEKLFRLADTQKQALKKLGIITAMDLLWYFPVRYGHISEMKLIKDILIDGEDVAIYGKITKIELMKGFKSKIPMAQATIEDGSGKINAVWFHQAFIAKMFAKDDMVELVGKTGKNKKGIYLANPEIRKVKHLPIDTHDSLFQNDESDVFGYPIYKETRGITSKMIYYLVQKVFQMELFKNIKDYIPQDIIEKYNLPDLQTALFWIHSPKKEEHSIRAKKRFSFEEIFMIQIERQKIRLEYQKSQTEKIDYDKKGVKEFVKKFGFELTEDQQSAIDTILTDMTKDVPMSRLLEGDVGSGKTAVAGVATYQTITTKLKDRPLEKLSVAYMAPTEILATQLFESFIKYFKDLNIAIGLITSSGCKKFPSKVNKENFTTISKPQLLKWVENGEIPIIIGTHSLIQKNIKFKNLGLAIIDEQHRFGTLQRQKFVRKNSIVPHLLSMTATPIPRTLALTIYGDLDLSIISSMPPGRKKIITQIISKEKRNEIYEHIKQEIKNKRQAYIICPRIDDNDEGKIQMRSVISEAKRLSERELRGANIGFIHSKMTKQKKEEIMADFYAKEIDVLVATSLVEVGINVPDASIIVIEGAERFGLAQLHQLRGRVLRGNHQPYCYLFTESDTQKTKDRLGALVNATNGFDLAEQDLKMRGSGELTGKSQWGISDIAMEALKNIKMVEFAREEAKKLVLKDPELKKYKTLASIISQKIKINHFE